MRRVMVHQLEICFDVAENTGKEIERRALDFLADLPRVKETANKNFRARNEFITSSASSYLEPENGHGMPSTHRK